MRDKNGSFANILPSGYTIISPLPRLVSSETILDEQKSVIAQSSQSFVTAVPILSFIFNLSMQ